MIQTSRLSRLETIVPVASLGGTPVSERRNWQNPKHAVKPFTSTKRPISYAGDLVGVTYKQFVALAADVFGQPPEYSVIGSLAMKVAGLFKKEVREISELLPRYKQDNLFDSSKFKRRFPDFAVTSYKGGLRQIQKQANAS